MNKCRIDAKREFNVSVSACLFYARIGHGVEYLCNEYDSIHGALVKTFGWCRGKFVSNLHSYDRFSIVDDKCEFVWRQGLKHDSSKVMELDYREGKYINKLGGSVELEDHLVYGLFKSSDLSLEQVKTPRKFTIVTQNKVGQSTDYIRNYPRTYKYLNDVSEYFDRRKSSIYKGKPRFSIFGIGAYSFKKYKVAISGMYRKTTFTIVYPDQNGKPQMLDDTCYFLGFDDLEVALAVQSVLNSPPVQNLLDSLIFQESKRSITKDILMRISLLRAADYFSDKQLRTKVKRKISDHQSIASIESSQLSIF
jgi:hypothetical protein